jgi:hypothetical protein
LLLLLYIIIIAANGGGGGGGGETELKPFLGIYTGAINKYISRSYVV